MTDPFYDAWLDDFQSEVSSVLAGGKPRPATEHPRSETGAVRQALADFDLWWAGEHPLTEEPAEPLSEGASRELDFARREIHDLRDQLSRLGNSTGLGRVAELMDKLRESETERARLRERSELLERQESDLRAAAAAAQSALASASTRASQLQSDVEARAARLEDEKRGLAERLAAEAGERRLVEQRFGELAKEFREAQEAYREAVSQKERLERATWDADLRAEAARKALGVKEAEAAGLEGSLGELRSLASALQERLVRGKEALDEEWGQARARLDALAQRHAESSTNLDDRGKELEGRVREAAEFLETRVRSLEISSEERFNELRWLLEALGRVRPPAGLAPGPGGGPGRVGGKPS